MSCPPDYPHEKLPQQSRILTDRFIEFVFLLLGVGVLLPWNAFISAKPYFQARLCAHNYSVASEIELWFSILYNGASVLSLAIVILCQFIAGSKDESIRKIAHIFHHPMCSKPARTNLNSEQSSSEYSFYLVMAPLAIYLVVFILTTILVFLPSIPHQLFLILTFGGLFICGVCTSVASSGIVGTAGLFDSNIGVNPYFNGQAVGGLLVAVANFAASTFNSPISFLIENCKSADGHSNQTINEFEDQDALQCIPYSEVSWATAAYFTMGCVVLAACMAGYIYVDQYKKLVRANSFGYSKSSSFTDYSSCGTDDTTDDDCIECASGGDIAINLLNHSPLHGGATPTLPESNAIEFQSYQKNEIEDGSHSAIVYAETCEESVTSSVWKVVRGPAIALFWTYFVTLALFPVWTSELTSNKECSSSSRLRNDLFSPLSFIIFNGGDLIGRTIAAEIQIERIQNVSKRLVDFSLWRFAFFILFLLCGARSSYFSEWVISSDIFSWTIQFMFALTNGALTTIAFSYAPGLVENRTNPQQVASAILNFSLSFGLMCGSFFALPFLNFASGKYLSHR